MEFPADFLSLGKGSVMSNQFILPHTYVIHGSFKLKVFKVQNKICSGRFLSNKF